MRKVCFVSSTRADYGLLKPLIKRLYAESGFEVQILVTGSHLSPEFGLTYKEIESDGFKINERVEILLSSDTPAAILKTMGVAFISLPAAFERLNPDLVVLLGDRYETLCSAVSCLMMDIPVAHIHGGEITAGVVDDSIRHAITKMSYIHFTSTEEYRKRVIQLGEHPERVFNVGALGLDSIKDTKLLTLPQIEKELGRNFERPYFLVTFHPVTLERNSSEIQMRNLLDALSGFKDYDIVFTYANADTYGRVINKLIEEYVSGNRNRSVAYKSLGQLKYLSMMKFCSCVIGNSSSGIIEAPYLSVPTVNIGDRQKGRVRVSSIFDCAPEKSSITSAIKKALEFSGFAEVKNPYGDGKASLKMVEILKKLNFETISSDLKKEFFNINVNGIDNNLS